MPELPEVTTVSQILQEEVQGLKISQAEIFYPKLIRDSTPEEFIKRVKNQRINKVYNQAKYIIFELDTEMMISHLRMEGRWAYEKEANFSYNKIIMEAQFKFHHQETVLRYYDLRRFGTLQLVTKKNFFENNPLDKKIGPAANNPHLTGAWLQEKWNKKHRAVKSLLLDQSIISGIGNIYANEILFAANIHPKTPGNTLTRQQLDLLLTESRRILNEAILHKGTTVRTFSPTVDSHGNYQKFLQVHNRQGKKCPRCYGTIIKIQLGGRGTYFCPNCQPS